jgi:hypothetical protein
MEKISNINIEESYREEIADADEFAVRPPVRDAV